ncbi:Hypothetical protein A7982_08815 [Minicystis rosea]|nr:Hypothetical protein A7982_08815 [Minicystis rosea]
MTTSHEDDLRADLAQGHVVCIAGAGVSLAAAAGGPARHPDPLTWAGLLDRGVHECCKLCPDDLDDAWAQRQRDLIASRHIDERNSAADHIGGWLGAPDGGDFGRWLRECFEDIPLCDSCVPDALAALGVPLLTTQIDDLLDRATGQPAVTWRDHARVERVLRGSEQAIVHLRGVFERPDTVVLGTRAFERLWHDPSAQALQQAFRALRTVIFVGADDLLEDPNLRALITWSRSVFKGSETRHYLLCRTSEREALQRRHPIEERLFALPYGDSQADLAVFLRRLAPAPRFSAPTGQIAARPPTTPFSDTDRNTYLDHLIGEFGLLDLRGLSGAAQSISIPLDQVYVELQGEPDNPIERAYDRRLLDADVREQLEKLGISDADEALVDEETNKVLACSGYALRVLQSGRRDVQGRPIAEARKPVPLAEVVRRERRAIILGDPGSGKTTLLKYLGLHYARAMREGKEHVLVAPQENASEQQEGVAKQADLGPTRLPIYVRIAAYAEARKKTPELAMLDFLPAYWEGQQLAIARGALRDIFEHHISNNTALVLLDGLDEVAGMRERQEIARQIETLVRTWARDPEPPKRDGRRAGWIPAPPPVEAGGNQVLVTSRIAGYHAAPLRDAIAHYTVQDMSGDAIDAFLRRWCLAVEQRQAGERPPAEQERRAEAQRQALSRALEHPRIQRLAVNPLLLTLLAMLNRSEGRLPRLRIELYESATRTLVETWRETGLSMDEVVDVLGPVALWIHTERPTGLASESELRRLVTEALAKWRGEDVDHLPGSFKKDVTDFIEAVRRESGLLLARGEGLYGFAHLTFQEYFVARQITRKAATTKEMVHEHLANPRWREPLLLAVAQIAKAMPDELEGVLRSALAETLPHDELLHRALLFVAAALPECGRAPAAVVRQVCAEMLKHYAESQRAERFKALRERLVSAYGALRGSEAGRFAEEVLCTTLAGADPALADAAAEIVALGKWHTLPAVAVVVRRAGAGAHRADTGYRTLEAEAGALFPASELPLRQAAFRHPEGWAKLIEDPATADIVWLCHTNPDVRGTERCLAEAITREAPFSRLLTSVLSAGAPGAALRARCLERWQQGGRCKGKPVSCFSRSARVSSRSSVIDRYSGRC